ncbi:hypothetical protein GHK34_26500 [Sinorhizobium meliloti]|nr:hypothetical protein [Sinorhizobium meliloti]MDX0042607.1 hypothetical protein [Sinorhizobium meliloti]MQU84686.1 hypothetical protein [Sinorhizobium meliloti]MQU87735.1 hypothetical protein [Sinorhizobium meliloti]
MFEAISQYLADTPHLQSLRRHPVPSSSRRRKKLHTSRTPTPDAFRWGRHHLGIRGRLFLGIGGRDHFGIRGRIASEFAISIAKTGVFSVPVSELNVGGCWSRKRFMIIVLPMPLSP